MPNHFMRNFLLWKNYDENVNVFIGWVHLTVYIHTLVSHCGKDCQNCVRKLIVLIISNPIQKHFIFPISRMSEAYSEPYQTSSRTVYRVFLETPFLKLQILENLIMWSQILNIGTREYRVAVLILFLFTKNYPGWVKPGRKDSKFTIIKYYISIVETIRLFARNIFMPVTSSPRLATLLF